MLLPLAYLVGEAFSADAASAWDTVFRWRSAVLLGNTLLLAATVLGATIVVALPTAYLTTRTDLPWRRGFTLLAVMPLALPGYLLAYTLLAMGGDFGSIARLTGLAPPRLSGFWGAAIALSFYNLPYMYLNLRVAMQRMDPALEEVARSLGRTPAGVFFSVVLPQMRSALLAGGLLVVLHVVGDFGVVSLMRFETFSFAIWQSYESFMGYQTAAWLALILVALAAVFMLIEWRLLRGLRLDTTGVTTSRARRPVRLGKAKWPALFFLITIALVGLFVPVATIVFWVTRHSDAAVWQGWLHALSDSLSVSVPAAFVSAALAVPVTYLSRRYPSPWSRALEQGAYLGYAIPALAFGLALLLMALRLDWLGLYQSATLLVIAYALHFLAEAVGPIRTSLYVATPRLEEAARSLGYSRAGAFFHVTLPLLRPGIVVAVAFVFLSAMKELPLTFVLSPPNFDTLAKRVWDHANEVNFAAAAPYALTILLLSSCFVGLLLLKGYEPEA